MEEVLEEEVCVKEEVPCSDDELEEIENNDATIMQPFDQQPTESPDSMFLASPVKEKVTKFFVANPRSLKGTYKDTLKLSISHEEELVAMALKLNSPAKAIKWYYKTYRPDDYACHNQQKNWSKNCKLKHQTVEKWVNKFKEFGYHRQKNIKKIISGTRPETGENSIPNITLTEYQKNIICSKRAEQSSIDCIKAFVQENYPKEYINHELYDDWDQCSITVNKINNWMKNLSNHGCVTVTRKYPSSTKNTRKSEEGLLRAESEIEEIKKSCKNKLELASNLTGRNLAIKMGVSRTTANRYLNILEGQGQIEVRQGRRQVLNKKKS